MRKLLLTLFFFTFSTLAFGNGAIDYDGSTEFTQVPDVTYGANQTSCLWFNSDVNQTGRPILADESGDTYVQLMYLTGNSGNTNCFARVNGTVYFTTDDQADSFYNNKWTHFCCTYDQSLGSERLKHYINGVEMDTDNTEDNPIQSGNDIKIANWDGGGDVFYNGKVADFAIWDATLTEHEIQTIYNSMVKRMSLQMKPDNLLVYYPMDECGGDNCTLYDASSNNNDSTSNTGDMNDDNGLSYP